MWTVRERALLRKLLSICMTGRWPIPVEVVRGRPELVTREQALEVARKAMRDAKNTGTQGKQSRRAAGA